VIRTPIWQRRERLAQCGYWEVTARANLRGAMQPFVNHTTPGRTAASPELTTRTGHIPVQSAHAEFLTRQPAPTHALIYAPHQNAASWRMVLSAPDTQSRTATSNWGSQNQPTSPPSPSPLQASTAFRTTPKHCSRTSSPRALSSDGSRFHVRCYFRSTPADPDSYDLGLYSLIETPAPRRSPVPL
jgi:hypothetical protein